MFARQRANDVRSKSDPNLRVLFVCFHCAAELLLVIRRTIPTPYEAVTDLEAVQMYLESVYLPSVTMEAFQ